jgi:DNA-binding FadR family transcriptional regulator
MTQSMFSLDNEAKERVPLTDAVLSKLTGLLLDRSLKPGDAFPSESELARNFDVSKPVIRLALRQLAAMGVVEIRQGKPSVVRPLDAKPLELYLQLAVSSLDAGLAEVIELRRALETHAAVLASATSSPEDIAQLEALIALMSANRDKQDEWVAADLEFHRVIARISGNTLLRFMNEALYSTMRYVIGTMHSRKDLRNADETVERHRQIVAAIAARDPEATRRAMNAHFDASVPVALRILRETGRGLEER